jgi:hypothetical protein
MHRRSLQRRFASTATALTAGGRPRPYEQAPIIAGRLTALAGALALGLAATPAAASAVPGSATSHKACDVTWGIAPEPPDDIVPIAVRLTLTNNDDEAITAEGMTLKPFRSGPFSIPAIEPGESNSIIVGGDVAGARVHVRYKILGAEGCRRKVHFIGVLPDAPPPR